MNDSEQTKLTKLGSEIRVQIQNLTILREALTHRSYLNESRAEQNHHNERLEFLGDAVLELVVTRFLFNQYPERPEGDLTSFRAALVRTESLADEAKAINLGDYLYMSKGEERTGGRNRPYILANAFEALIGAIYLDQGYTAAEKFLAERLFPKIERIVKDRLDLDSKSRLQELAQEVMKLTPNYQLKGEAGPDHNKTFTMAVFLGEQELASGEGKSKQEAEQNAAASALQNWPTLYQKQANSDKIATV